MGQKKLGFTVIQIEDNGKEDADVRFQQMNTRNT